MTRRRVLAAIPAALPAAAYADGGGDPIVEFHFHWNRFFRAYLGCPAKATDASQCDPAMATRDYAEFLKAAKIGRKLFEL